jgi:hypothetical protein
MHSFSGGQAFVMMKNSFTWISGKGWETLGIEGTCPFPMRVVEFGLSKDREKIPRRGNSRLL